MTRERWQKRPWVERIVAAQCWCDGWNAAFAVPATPVRRVVTVDSPSVKEMFALDMPDVPDTPDTPDVLSVDKDATITRLGIALELIRARCASAISREKQPSIVMLIKDDADTALGDMPAQPTQPPLRPVDRSLYE